MNKLFALRGAVQCENTVQDICKQVSLMYDELLLVNNLAETDIVSVIFSVTDDLNAVNPCSALRKSGSSFDGETAADGFACFPRASETALFAVQEPNCQNSLERTIRVIIHCYLDEGTKVKHVYRNGAEVLRPDRAVNR